MPLSVMKKLQIKEAQPTRIALQMVDKSLKPAHGLVGNILVKVEKFFLPVDFVILDTLEDENASIILGRPFLATGRALVDMEEGELVLRVHNEQLAFPIFKTMHSSGREEKCIQTDLIVPNLQEPPSNAQQGLQLKPPLMGINTISPDIKPKFGFGCVSSTKEEVPKKKMSRG
ncbi:hypothetical protein AHAS_Ahas18G0205400 [Arachis hypogaea]